MNRIPFSKRAYRPLLLTTLGAILAGPAAGQFDFFHWIGPEAACEYASIQEAIDDIFGGFIPPLGLHHFRLAASYDHSGTILIRNSLSISGGWSHCGGVFTGARKNISAQGAARLIVVAPGSGSIGVTLDTLNLFGNVAVMPGDGGVVVLAGDGAARLTMQDVGVIGGRAEAGGGIAVRGEGQVLELIDVDVVDNEAVAGQFAEGDGGGIHCEDGGVIELKSGRVANNVAQTRGGGIHLEGCTLLGNYPGLHRSIEGNYVSRSAAATAAGKGGGVYAGGATSRVELGAVQSRTTIEGNEVRRWTASDFNSYASAHGGGLHLQREATAVLRNVQLIANEAPSGGGISIETGATLDMDRTSGPCAVPRPSACSALIGNRASGDSNGNGENINSGDGAAIFRRAGGNLLLRRTEVRGNESFNHADPGEVLFSTLINTRGGGGGDVVLDGNLIFSNFVSDSSSFSKYLQLISIDELRVRRNTIAYHPSEAKAFFAFATGVGALGELIANVIWEPDTDLPVLGDGDRAEVAACNVHHRAFDAVAEVLNVIADPEFVDSGNADFRLLAFSPAVNRCDDGVGLGQLEPTYDIEGRARPSTDGFGQLGEGRPWDAGAFEYHAGLPDEVDLEVEVEPVDDPASLGATFEVVVTNVGLTTAQNGNFDLSFPRPSRGYTAAGWTACVEETAGSSVEVRCSNNIPTGLPTLFSTTPLRVSVAPDASGTCGLAVRTDSGSQPDTVAINDSKSHEVFCGADPSLVFETSFETGDTSEWSGVVGGS